MNELVSRQQVHETVLREYENIELHPEVPPGLVLPTFYNMHTIYSRVARINRPVVPDINQIDEFVIPEHYSLITVDNVQQNFVLHRQAAMNVGIQNEHCYQSRTLFQFNNGARFALRKKQYRINEEHIAFLVEERERGNLDTLQFLDCIYRRIGD